MYQQVIHTRPIGFDSPNPFFFCCLALIVLLALVLLVVVVRVFQRKQAGASKLDIVAEEETHT